MLMYLWVVIGGALGTVGRFWLSGLVAARFGETFPSGTLVIEIVDREEKINAFLPVLDEIMTGGLVTLEKVRLIDSRAARIHQPKPELKS